MAFSDRFKTEFDAQLIKSTERIRQAVRINKGSQTAKAEIADQMATELEKYLIRASVLRGFKPRPETIKLLVRSFDYDFAVGMAIQADVDPAEKVLPEAYTLFLCDLVEHERLLRRNAEEKLESFERFVRFFGFRWCSCGEWVWFRHRHR